MIDNSVPMEEIEEAEIEEAENRIAKKKAKNILAKECCNFPVKFMQWCSPEHGEGHWEFHSAMAGAPFIPYSRCKWCVKEDFQREKEDFQRENLLAHVQGQRQQIISRREQVAAEDAQQQEVLAEHQRFPLEPKLKQEALKLVPLSEPKDVTDYIDHNASDVSLNPGNAKHMVTAINMQAAVLPEQDVRPGCYYYYNYSKHPWNFFESEPATERLKVFFKDDKEIQVLSVEEAKRLSDSVDLFGLLQSRHDSEELLRTEFVLYTEEPSNADDLRLKLLDFERSTIWHTGKKKALAQLKATIFSREAAHPWVTVRAGPRPMRMSRARSAPFFGHSAVQGHSVVQGQIAES